MFSLWGEAIACTTIFGVGAIYNWRKTYIQELISNPPCRHEWETTDTEDYTSRDDGRNVRIRLHYMTCKKCGTHTCKKLSDYI